MGDINNKLNAVVKGIEQRHRVAMEAGVKQGKTTSLEQLWRDTVEERWSIKSFAFTDREKANLKMCVREFGQETGSLIISAIKSWREMRSASSLNLIAEMPEFGSFFSFRKKIYGWVKARERQEEKKTEPLRNLKETPDSRQAEVPKVGLFEMFKQERAKIQAAKEKLQKESEVNNGR